MLRRVLQETNHRFTQKRFYNKQQIKVRFAPSPTGHLHLGGLRTALYNYLFARANDGAFILRIEDTDQSRVLPEAIEKLQDDLSWAGIIPDEGPIRGGPNGPYIQSKRIEIYKEHIQKLLNNKTAYYCFCTQFRLDLVRREAIKCGLVPKYDSRCRHLDDAKVKEKLEKGEPYCIRFKLLPDVEVFDDLICGPVSHNVSQAEGDPIIIKSDGYPTYHFANVVDDHLMQISHVLRGIEWQTSTAKHLMMYKAFGWTPPKFGHLPLILNTDNTKLSKRHHDIKVDTYRQQGIFPLALINYITLTGGGFRREPGPQSLYSYEELIKQFDIAKLHASSSKLRPEKLLEFNKLEIARLLTNKENEKLMVQKVINLILQTFPDRKDDNSLQLDENYIITVLKWAQSRISNLTDLVTPAFSFLWVTPSCPPKIAKSEYLDVIKTLSSKLMEIDISDFEEEWINTYLKELASTNGIAYNEMMRLLRAILSDLKVGPPVAEMMVLLGRERTLSLIQRSIT